MKPASVDANVLVRLATGDNAAEHRAVPVALAHRPWRVLSTVLLETEWVLRSLYAYSPEQFADFVDWLITHPRIMLADVPAARMAIAHHRAGLDFADALHLAQADGPFLTLDKKLLKRAAKLGLAAEAVRPTAA
ncbi:MAG: type II toxin-antitoxin system VapC family toxin [Panacagrimonas sp.]